MKRLVSLMFHDVYERDPSESGFRGPAANRYKLTVAELEAQLAGVAVVRPEGPILVGESRQRDGGPPAFAITVDDGGVSYYTRVANRLEARGWRGHCFITTSRIGQPGFLDEGQIRELHARGHLIGSHSVSHPRRFGALRWDDMVREWTESRAVLADIVGEDVTVASVPGGNFSPRVAQAARAAGLRVLFTSEPETCVRSVAGCAVIGRFAVRCGCAPDFARRLGVLEPFTMRREWLAWNAKKLIKWALGAAYPHLATGAYGGGDNHAR
ncbi:MAG: polysaccharide deacetylase family protein [Candidatus Rokubacteria bacterium]|nr:polysaccharide deacetylase family protein [Candidatus Rokubacteria bacterium]